MVKQRLAKFIVFSGTPLTSGTGSRRRKSL